MLKMALVDIIEGMKKINLWSYMAWKEIVIRYRRSVLGPFWITASTFIYIVSISLVFSTLFNQDVKHYILYMSIGVLVWNYINQTIVESADCFINCSGFIKQIKIERSVFIYQSIARNIYFFLHNAVILVISVLYLDNNISFYTVGKAVFGFSILTINLFFISLALACVCARFMDFRQIVASVLQIGFLITPVMWIPTESMRSRAFLMEWNPFYHFIDFIRYSLLPDDFPPAVIHPDIVYIFVFSIINVIISFTIFSFVRKKIPYWV